MKLSVYGILIDSHQKVLMHKRANTSYANGWWSFPGGHVEAGESICSAICRELWEEVGVEVLAQDCAFQLTLIRKPILENRYINFFYVIKDWKNAPTISDGKASELSFFSFTHLPNPTLPHIQEALQLIRKGIQFYESTY